MSTKIDEQLKYLTENYVGKLCVITANMTVLPTEELPAAEVWKAEREIKKGTTVLVVKITPRGVYGDNQCYNVWVLNDTKVMNIFGMTYKTIVNTTEWALFKWL